MKRYAKELDADLKKIGFEYIWTNASGGRCYAHPDDPAQTEVIVNTGIDEKGARSVLRRAQRLIGALPAADKRRPQQIKERQAAVRDHARSLLDEGRAEHRRLIADGAAPGRIAAVKRLVEQRERELDRLERLMVEPPAGGSAHRGRGQARHRTGRTP